MDLSWASSRLEGNTYSLLDTKRLIEFGEAAQGKDAAETQMILTHKAAVEFMVDLKDELAFNRQVILNFHAILSDNLLADPNASGRLRRIVVGIGNSVYHPLEVPLLIEECFQQVNVFVWAYERSAQRYVAVRQSLGEPDKFRLRFRNELIEVVGDIVRRRLSPTVEEVTKPPATVYRRKTWTTSFV